MEQVTVYLRTARFSLGGKDAHVPIGVLVIDGQITDRPAGALTLQVERCRDGRGKVLSETAVTVQLPWSKIDHIHQR